MKWENCMVCELYLKKKKAVIKAKTICQQQSKDLMSNRGHKTQGKTAMFQIKRD